MAQIDKPNLHFNTVTYTGNGSYGHGITGVGFQPDFVWIKRRDGNAKNHELYDAVRGTDKAIYSSANAVEGTGVNLLHSFDSDGFTVDDHAGINSSNNFVSWNWKAGGTTSSNTDGDITSTVSVNTTAGFSIVSYTGNGSTNQTIGHGLGVKPAVIIIKNRDDTNNWVMYHHKLNNGTNPEVKYLELNSTNAQLDDASIFNDTAPTSTLFTIGNASDTGSGSGGNNEKIIAYCFAEKKGYSKFGSYSGNADANGTFVYTGFKPAFVLLKSINNGGWHWRLMDTVRDNSRNDGTNNILFPNHNSAEITNELDIDYLSNGFKIRDTRTGINGSGWTISYMAFAKEPLVGSNDVPATAI